LQIGSTINPRLLAAAHIAAKPILSWRRPISLLLSKSQILRQDLLRKITTSRAESSRPLLGSPGLHPIISSCLCIKTPFARSQWLVFDITPLRAVLGLFERSSTSRDLPSRIRGKIRPNGFLEKRRPRICSPLNFRVRLLH
jgi:hypothetical protein